MLLGILTPINWCPHRVADKQAHRLHVPRFNDVHIQPPTKEHNACAHTRLPQWQRKSYNTYTYKTHTAPQDIQSNYTLSQQVSAGQAVRDDTRSEHPQLHNMLVSRHIHFRHVHLSRHTHPPKRSPTTPCKHTTLARYIRKLPIHNPSIS
jgi:hypothetical protein